MSFQERPDFDMRWWHWALAGGGVFVVLGIIAAAILGILASSGPPIGREAARQKYEGNAYVLVEYGGRLAIFSASGAPVSRRGLAEGILRSYAWRQVIEDFDIDGLANVSGKASRLDDDLSHARSLSNDVVAILDELDDVRARVPLLGSVSALDVIADLFPGVGDAEDVIRSLDTELNELGESATSLARASKRVGGADPSSVSGDEMDALFANASDAARDLGDSVRAGKDLVLVARESVDGLENALRVGSDTPIIGGALRESARSAGQLESELASLLSLMGSFESELEASEEEMQDALDRVDGKLASHMKRWLAEPPDTEWPPAEPEVRP